MEVKDLLLHHLDNFAAFVFPAVRAHAVREFRFVAVGALRQTGFFQVIMRAAR
jgi:hypothetical protein